MEPAVYPHSMEDRCLVAPHPEVRKKILNSFRELKDMVGKNGDHAILQNLLRPVERRPAGFNDGLLRPHSTFRPGTTLAAARAARVKPRGVNYVAVVLVDSPSLPMASLGCALTRPAISSSGGRICTTPTPALLASAAGASWPPGLTMAMGTILPSLALGAKWTKVG